RVALNRQPRRVEEPFRDLWPAATVVRRESSADTGRLKDLKSGETDCRLVKVGESIVEKDSPAIVVRAAREAGEWPPLEPGQPPSTVDPERRFADRAAQSASKQPVGDRRGCAAP